MKLLDVFESVLFEGSVKPDERVKIYDDNNFLVVRPLSHTASRKYGCYSKWCSATSNKDEFDRYNSSGNYLIYIINKNYVKPENSPVNLNKIAIEVEYDGNEIYLNWYDADNKNIRDTNYNGEILPDYITKIIQNYIKQNKPI
jgi:hypothetical protein